MFYINSLNLQTGDAERCSNLFTTEVKKMWKKGKNPCEFRNTMNQYIELKKYRMMEIITTMHSVLDEQEVKAVKRSIEELPDD